MSLGFLASNREAPVMWRGPRKDALIRQFLKDVFWSKLDVLLFDTPPGTSDEHLTTVSALAKCGVHGAILVTTPQSLSLDMLRKEYTFCQKLGVPVLGVVSNMCGFKCPCCGQVEDIWPKSDLLQQLCAEWGVPVLDEIPMDPASLQEEALANATCFDEMANRVHTFLP